MDVVDIERFSHQNERSLLALLIQNPEYLETAATKLRDYMLSSSIHRTIYEGMLGALKEEGVDVLVPSIIIQYLHRKDMLASAGGEGHINSLNDEKVEQNFEFYLKAVIDTYKSGQLLTMSERIPRLIRDISDSDRVVAEIRESLDSIETKISANGVVTVSEAAIESLKVIRERMDGDTKYPGISTGLPSLDRLVGGYIGGDEWIICSRPGHGKTSTLLQTAIEVARGGHGVLLFQKEMSLQQLMERLLAYEADVEHSKIKFGDLKKAAFRDLKSASKFLGGLPIFFDTNIYGDIYYVTGVIRKYKRQYPHIKVVGIDYIQLLAERSLDQTQELGRISRMLKLMAVDLDITMIVASQLNRKVEERESKIPILSDIRQSGNLEEDADIVLGLYRRDMYEALPSSEQKKLQMHILKQRNGPTGLLEFRIDEEKFRLIDKESMTDIKLSKRGK